MVSLSRAFRGMRDLCIVGIGVLVMFRTPGSVDHGLTHPWVEFWSVTLLVGGLVCIFGGVFRRAFIEVVGCLLVAAGFSTWAFAAVYREDSDAVTWAIALLLVAGVAGQGYRVVEVIQDARPVIFPEVQSE